ncbi:hypothetical protein [Streptomyces sp. PRh5]|uniref:hypothetical protein n=1 Tax=Streptomyces sp. PRh5 TaxID=1158056 RepID=UPI0004B07726|nr:hypothetical protein [Streptomyces sp. PRh5]
MPPWSLVSVQPAPDLHHRPGGIGGPSRRKSLADGDVLRIEIGALGDLENTVHVRAASAGRRS